MNLKILALLTLYWIAFLAVFATGGSYLVGYSASNITGMTNSSYLSGEQDQGGLFGTGVSFGRFFLFAGFGLGLPSTVPAFIQFFVFLWQTFMTIFTVGFLVSSIWNG